MTGGDANWYSLRMEYRVFVNELTKFRPVPQFSIVWSSSSVSTRTIPSSNAIAVDVDDEKHWSNAIKLNHKMYRVTGQ